MATLKKRKKLPEDEIVTSPIIQPTNYIPSGCTLLNLALSNTIHGGYTPGTIINIIGDSHAGKTLLLWTMFAEIVRDSRFNDYRIVYNEPEQAFYMDTDALFGPATCKVERDKASRTIQEWQSDVVREMSTDTPIIYGLDSFDALSSIEEQDRIKDLIKTGEMGGSYRTEKARIGGEVLRNICGAMYQSKSLLALVSQTRDNIGAMFGSGKTRSGGRALDFFSTHIMWLSVKSAIRKTTRGVSHIVGGNVVITISKNKITGYKTKIEVPIMVDYGIDNTMANINYLLENKGLHKKGTLLTSDGVFPELNKSDLVDYIETENKYTELEELVGEVWGAIKEELKTKRKARYSE